MAKRKFSQLVEVQIKDCTDMTAFLQRLQLALIYDLQVKLAGDQTSK